MSESKQNFIKAVCNQIKVKCVHKTVINELEDHLSEQKKEYIRQGLKEEEAIEKAIKQMGDPVLIGNQFNKTYRPKTEWSLIAITLFLLLCGGIVQFFISSTSDYDFYQNGFSQLLLYAPLGIMAAVFIYFFDYTLLCRFPKTIFAALFIISIAGFALMGRINGSYAFGFYSALLFIPCYAGIIYSFRGKGYPGIILSGLFYILPASLCFSAPSFSGLFLLTASCLFMLTFAINKGYFGGSRKVGLAIIYIPFLISACAVLALLKPFQSARIKALFDPQAFFASSGWVATQVRKLIEAAQPFGAASLGGDYAQMPVDQILPGINSGFSLTYIFARFGYIAGILVILAFLLLIVKMLKVVFKEKNIFGLLFSMGACLALSGQIICYIASNLGFTLVSCTLPFISLGKIGFIINMILISILLSVRRRTNIVRDVVQNAETTGNRLFTVSEGKLIIDLGQLKVRK